MAGRMSKKTWLILAIVIIAVGAIVGIALSCNSSSPSDSMPQSQKAPDFTLPTLTGAEITLSELEGTPVVLVFWATWCRYCPTELHRLEDVAQQSEGEIKVIAINIDKSTSTVQTFFGDYEPTMIVALDSNKEAFVDYCLTYNNTRGAIPFTLFVDGEGLVKDWKVGAFASEAALWDTLHDVFGITIP
jgi:peroxiredoxin